MENNFNQVERRLLGGLVGILVTGALLLFVFLLGFRTVDAGEVAVVRRFGAVTGRILEPGAHFITPFVEGTTYINTKFLLYETMKEADIKRSESNYKETQVDTNTKDGQRVDLFYTIRFSIDPKRANWVVENFGSEQILVDNIVRAESRSKARIIPSNFSAEDLYVGEGKQKVADELYQSLKDKLADNGIRLDAVLVREIGFTDAYVQAIEAKQIEAVKVDAAKNIALRAEQEKKTRITQAEAQAEEQRLQQQTLTPILVQKQMIEKWDGHYPGYLFVGAQGSNFLLPLPGQ